MNYNDLCLTIRRYVFCKTEHNQFTLSDEQIKNVPIKFVQDENPEPYYFVSAINGVVIYCSPDWNPPSTDPPLSLDYLAALEKAAMLYSNNSVYGVSDVPVCETLPITLMPLDPPVMDHLKNWQKLFDTVKITAELPLLKASENNWKINVPAGYKLTMTEPYVLTVEKE